MKRSDAWTRGAKVDKSKDQFRVVDATAEFNAATLLFVSGSAEASGRRSVPFELPTSQRYFWSAPWQAGEDKVDRELDNGEFAEFDTANPQAAIDWLHED